MWGFGLKWAKGRCGGEGGGTDAARGENEVKKGDFGV